MKLATHITAEKGKELVKTANEYINIELTENKINKITVLFTGGYIRITEAVPNNNKINGKILFAKKI